jgi:hypothetical protein
MSQSVQSRLRAMGNGDRVIVAGSIVLLVAILALPWIGASCSAPACGGLSAGISGAHGWGWLTLLALVAVIALFTVRELVPDAQLPELPLRDPQLYMVLGAVEALGVLLFWVEYHDSFISVLGVSVGLAVGWFVALAGAVLTIVGGYLASSEPGAPPPAVP